MLLSAGQCCDVTRPRSRRFNVTTVTSHERLCHLNHLQCFADVCATGGQPVQVVMRLTLTEDHVVDQLWTNLLEPKRQL